VPLSKGTAGLKKGGAVLCHQITTLDRAKLSQKIGTLPPELLAQVESGILAALDIER
jgi:mRNA-degrading endonuclease toxin of MazEF toxin-antitoxin module